MQKTDSEIKQVVLRELEWDTRVNEAEIGVAVTAGVVTLSGTVGSWGEKLAAREAAHRVACVHDVANHVTVKMPGSSARSDTDIARAIRSVLDWDVFVPETHIRSTVSEGWVTLEGDVDNWNQRSDADRAVRNLAGVCGVTNKTEIKPPKLAPSDVRRSVAGALERRAEREAGRIALDIEDGRVTLSGVVPSLATRNVVVGAAKATTGVRDVVDHLVIRPHGA